MKDSMHLGKSRVSGSTSIRMVENIKGIGSMGVNMDVEYCLMAKESRRRWGFGGMGNWS